MKKYIPAFMGSIALFCAIMMLTILLLPEWSEEGKFIIAFIPSQTAFFVWANKEDEEK